MSWLISSSGYFNFKWQHMLAIRCALKAWTINSSPTLNTFTPLSTCLRLMYSHMLQSEPGRSWITPEDEKNDPETFPRGNENHLQGISSTCIHVHCTPSEQSCSTCQVLHVPKSVDFLVFPLYVSTSYSP